MDINLCSAHVLGLMIHQQRKKNAGGPAAARGGGARGCSGPQSLLPPRPGRAARAMSQPAVLNAPDPLLPPFAVAVCIACVAGAGILCNFSVITALLKFSNNGLSAIIIQLAIADVLILCILSGPELWFFNIRTWNFGHNCCTAFRGLSVFASTASSYLIATVALHTIATINLEEKAMERKMKRNRETEDEEIKSSHHSLVANSDSSTPPRTMNLDYRLVDTTVRVTPPVLFIWILSASLSIPEFVLATTININEKVSLCTSIDSHHKLNTISWLATFNLILPGTIMCITGVIVISKLLLQKRTLSDQNKESVSALKLSLCLIILYWIFCTPRSITTVYRLYSRSFGEDQISSFESEKLDGIISPISLAFSGTFMLAAALRPVLSMLLLPKLKNVLSNSTKYNERYFNT
ncbi:unnamed protein product [Diatraea saccharalis]|uniref:G-protein coupled receptors family 1 profile domain-containing protein n=1 Tax=Diatraea saccharalis TaxID=40085 RepID=A0A9N9WIM1_9NEOP|nr:unnamed protein product [Diatraea saccharalis]